MPANIGTGDRLMNKVDKILPVVKLMFCWGRHNKVKCIVSNSSKVCSEK